MFGSACLQLENLACRRGDKILFSALDLSFEGGQFIQIEGHNGIGKTSLLRILSGLMPSYQGKVYWNGMEIAQQREEFHYCLLYLGHYAGIKVELSSWENLAFYQQIGNCHQGQDILWEAIEKIGLLGREDLPAHQLSAGQQKRIALARLWLSQAPLWILDEPFTAIDKKGVEILTSLFEQQVDKGGLVIITSHQEIPTNRIEKVNLNDYKIK
ncbi:cytochrome c biogenesis heme-transporting ATPase CcmA [Rodentibacter caecimuris]|uniref:Heme ABC transporter ATP-binding protein CcmA n=1 Tax=Rodentibacter caecimuris TaxID=1796644 RepID=A0ABX3L019_9PAST|nr:heme ABC transporter ATP-binding protein CcmA [Rodentibacter heylii]